MSHHTKDKGDVAVAEVIADAAKAGIKACIPITEHLPFDLVLVNADCVLRRGQVRYATRRGNKIIVRLRSCYSWSRGSQSCTLDRTKIDGFAIYCPDTDKTYYLRTDEIPASVSAEVWFSFEPNAKRVANDFLGVDRLFAPVAQTDRASVF
jgi:hypothetical protein